MNILKDTSALFQSHKNYRAFNDKDRCHLVIYYCTYGFYFHI